VFENYGIGKCYCIEFGVEDPIIQEIKTDFAHTNHSLYDTSITIDNEEAGSLTRLNLVGRLLPKVQNVEDMKSLLLDDSGGTEKGILNDSNVANVIIDSIKQVMYVRLLRESEKGWQEYNLKNLLF
jgi:hypothetical protein